MITVDFTPMKVTTYLQCRRGRNVYRKVRIDIGMRQAVYNALPQCALEVVDATGHVWSRADISQNRGYLLLDYQGPPEVKFDPFAAKELKAKQEKEERKATQNKVAQALKVETKARKLKEAEQVSQEMILKKLEDSISDIDISKIGKDNEGIIAPEPDQRPETKDNDDVQQVDGERNSDGETIRRAVHLQVPLVGEVNARLVRKEERGSEGSPDGLHSSDDEQDVLDN